MGVFLFWTGCEKDAILDDEQSEVPQYEARKPGAGVNNLSFPVIWAEGIPKALPGTQGMAPVLNGEWWYWWGDPLPDGTLQACRPDADNEPLCDNGDSPGDGWVKAYVQKDEFNVWQAGAINGPSGGVYVDQIDWGDNLESVDWYTRSQVRTEVVLYKNVSPSMLEYQMRHIKGWGTDEVHGLAVKGPQALEGSGLQATVYSPCARLTIQRLRVDRDDPQVGALVWDPINKYWTEPSGSTADLINAPLFNLAAWQSQDGPGYYNAEINVKGKVIYGYTWNVRRLNEGAGDYRITFSLSTDFGGPANKTFLDNAQIIGSAEGVVVVTSEPGGGGVPVLRKDLNLTYIDIRIAERSGGGGPGGGGPGGNGGNGGNGGH